MHLRSVPSLLAPLVFLLFLSVLLLSATVIAHPPATPTSPPLSPCAFSSTYTSAPWFNITMYQPRCTCPHRKRFRQHPLHPTVAYCASACLNRMHPTGSSCSPDTLTDKIYTAFGACCHSCASIFRLVGIASYSSASGTVSLVEYSSAGCDAVISSTPSSTSTPKIKRNGNEKTCTLRVRENYLRFRLPQVSRQCSCGDGMQNSWAAFVTDRVLFPCISACMKQGHDGQACNSTTDAEGPARDTFQNCCKSDCAGRTDSVPVYAWSGPTWRKFHRLGCLVHATPTPIATLPPTPPCTIATIAHDTHTDAPFIETACTCPLNSSSSGTFVAASGSVFPCVRDCMADANDGAGCTFGANNEGERSVTMFRTCCLQWCGGMYGTADVGERVDVATLYSNARYRAGCVSKMEGLEAMSTGLAEEEEEEEEDAMPTATAEEESD